MDVAALQQGPGGMAPSSGNTNQMPGVDASGAGEDEVIDMPDDFVAQSKSHSKFGFHITFLDKSTEIVEFVGRAFNFINNFSTNRETSMRKNSKIPKLPPYKSKKWSFFSLLDF